MVVGSCTLRLQEMANEEAQICSGRDLDVERHRQLGATATCKNAVEIKCAFKNKSKNPVELNGWVPTVSGGVADGSTDDNTCDGSATGSMRDIKLLIL